jgi:Leucine-rich repeat (LRR) protein
MPLHLWLSSLQLEHLDMSCNMLTELPASIGSLGHTLRKLNVSENSLSFLPEGLGGLTQLRTLRASNNVLTELPDSLAQLQVGVLGTLCLLVVLFARGSLCLLR